MKFEKSNRNTVKWILPALTLLALLTANPAMAGDEKKVKDHEGPQSTMCLQVTNSMPLLTCSGEAGRTYYIEATTSLLPPVSWERVCTNEVASGGKFCFTDVCASNYPARFYRVVVEDKQNNGAFHGRKLGHDKQP